MASVSINSLDVAFGTVKVIENLNLDVEEGEFIVLLGPSGCGKSTLLNSIAGLLDIADGEIWIDGKNVTWEEPKDRGIGMVFQSYALYPRMTVAGNLSFGLKMAKVPKPEIAERIKGASELLHIDDLMHRRPVELSGGQRQRVAIGRALVRDVNVYLFDEPLSNLDAALRTELRVELKRLHRELGNSTMIYVTHDQVEALTLADRIAVMHGGIIQQLASPRTIYHRPANRFVAGFVGSPRMNFIAGHIETGSGDPVFVAGEIAHPLGDYDFAEPPSSGTAAELGIRPEHVRIDPDNGGHTVTVEIVEPMGAETVVWCSLAGHTIGLRLDGDAAHEPQDTLKVGFPGDRLNLFDRETGSRL
ncbi:MAG: sn-glycerol-3-phosphate ABC transporter ATP-binding protein UgpC [Inquilinus sp.]|nr:sn-glycerol-3-phosphate ABC transporter ATP-binding protein UgpC [Inquilinus sp.]